MSKNVWDIRYFHNTYSNSLDVMLYLDDEKIKQFTCYSPENATEEFKKCFMEFAITLKNKGHMLVKDEAEFMRDQLAKNFSGYKNRTLPESEQQSSVKPVFRPPSSLPENKTDSIGSNDVKTVSQPLPVPPSASVQDIINNTCYFSKYQLDTYLFQASAGTKELIPGMNRLPKSINLLTASGKKYYAKITKIEVLDKTEKDGLPKTFSTSGSNAFAIFESFDKATVVAFSFGYIGETTDAIVTEYYEFKEHTVSYVDKVPVARYSLAASSVRYDFNSPLAPTLLPILEYYNLLKQELDKKSESTKITVDLPTLRNNYNTFFDLAVDENLIVIPVIGKAEKIRSLSLKAETYTGNYTEYDFFDGSLITILQEDKHSYLEALYEEGVILPSNTDLALIDLVNVSEKDVFLFRKIFADSNIKRCVLSTNIKGEKVRLDRVEAGIKSALSGRVANSNLVDVICRNNISYLKNQPSNSEYQENQAYIDYLKKEYPVLKKNEEQLIAIDKILQMKENGIDVLLVQGPPGTGKTELILALAKELYKANCNTLITSNVHVACDNIVDRLKNNKDLVLKRYTTVHGDQYLKELVENKKKYVENQVLEGFKFNDVIINSAERYKEIKSFLELEKTKKETILQSKMDYDAKLKPYSELVEISKAMQIKFDEISGFIDATKKEISYLENTKIETDQKISDKKLTLKDTQNEILVTTASLDSEKKILDEKIQQLNNLYALNAKIKVLLNQKNEHISSLKNENASLISTIQSEEETAAYLQATSEDDIKTTVLSFLNERKGIADQRLKKLVPNTLKHMEELCGIYDVLKEDSAFWNSSENASLKTIEFVHFRSTATDIIREFLGDDTIGKLEETYFYLKASNAKHNLMSVLPFLKINGKNKTYYDNCIRQINSALKKIQINCSAFIMPHLQAEASDTILQQLYKAAIEKIANYRSHIVENEQLIVEEKEQISAISDELEQSDRHISLATNDLYQARQKCSNLEGAIKNLAQKSEELGIEIENLTQEAQIILKNTENQSHNLREYVSAEAQIKTKIHENDAKIKETETCLGVLIANYATFAAKMEIDIKNIDKNLAKYSIVIEKIESKIDELTASGWSREDAETFVFDYANELNNIAECDSQKAEQNYFIGRGNEFNEMFSLDDNSGASLISMTTNQIASLFKSADKKDLTFDYAIIDEASKCRFEDLIISLPRIKHLVLIGDFMQLDPLCDNYTSLDIAYQNIFTQKSWETFNKSSFSMLLSQFVESNIDTGINGFDSNPHIAVMKRQYRMNKGIFDLIKPIYDIHEGFELIDEKKTSANDLKCININGKEVSMLTSYYNIEEADAIIAFISELKQQRSKYPHIKTIGIITGYKAQENYLRRQLKKLKIKGIQLGTFDRFQGREYDLVIISLVRSEKFGFTNNVRRMNVAFSRAKNHLLVFGNFDKLNKLTMKYTKSLNSDVASIEAKENDFVLKTLIPKLYALREDFVSTSDCATELLAFLKENNYE